MPARKHTQWLKKPTVDYVDSRIYSDWDIHYEEQERFLKKFGYLSVMNQNCAIIQIFVLQVLLAKELS